MASRSSRSFRVGNGTEIGNEHGTFQAATDDPRDLGMLPAFSHGRWIGGGGLPERRRLAIRSTGSLGNDRRCRVRPLYLPSSSQTCLQFKCSSSVRPYRLCGPDGIRLPLSCRWLNRRVETIGAAKAHQSWTERARHVWTNKVLDPRSSPSAASFISRVSINLARFRGLLAGRIRSGASLVWNLRIRTLGSRMVHHAGALEVEWHVLLGEATGQRFPVRSAAMDLRGSRPLRSIGRVFSGRDLNHI
jgi:hypothetical protein